MSHFPLYISVKEGGPSVDRQENSLDFVVSLLEIFVKDTPFRRKDLYEINEQLDEAGFKSYSERSIREAIVELQDLELVRVLDDGFSEPGKTLFYFYPATL